MKYLKNFNESFEGNDVTNVSQVIKKNGKWEYAKVPDYESWDGEKWKVGEKVSIKDKSYSNDPKSLNGTVSDIGLKDSSIMIKFKSEKGSLTQFSPEELEKN